VSENSVKWDEAPLARWMGSIVKQKTIEAYKSSFKLYLQYTGLTPKQLLDEALEDQRKDASERRDIVKQRIIGFYNWLTNEAPKRPPGYHSKVIGKGLGSKTVHRHVGGVRSFYATFDIFVKLKGRSSLPKPRVANKRMLLSNMDVKVLVDNARIPRDRAMILTMFQGGMDVSTLCGMKVGDVAEGLAKNEHPLQLNLYRIKTGIEYYTFLGRDAAESLKAYMNDLRGKGLTLSPNDFLFIKESSKAKTKEGLTTNLVQNMMRDVAIKSGFIDKHFNGKDFNPLGPHALRESFGSIMINKGVPDSIVDFWLGHEIGEMAEAYKRGKEEDLRRIYLEREPFISISTGGEIEEKLRAEIDEKNKQLQTLVNGLSAENLELKSRMSKMELDHMELKKRIQEEISEIKKEVEKLIT